jgi:hypothetical protein
MSLELSKEGIDKLEKLKLEYPKYSEVIDDTISLAKQGETEAALLSLIIINLVLKGVD